MTLKALLLSAATLTAFVQLPITAFAGGPGDTPPSCLLTNPGGATAIRGTIAVGVQDASSQANTDVDFMIRLERGGAVRFFRTSVNMQVFATSNENILCTLLRDSASPGATGLRAAIRQAFGFPSNAAFWITDKSLSNAEIQGSTPQWVCDDTYTDGPTPPTSCAPPPRGASMADVTIYVK